MTTYSDRQKSSRINPEASSRLLKIYDAGDAFLNTQTIKKSRVKQWTEDLNIYTLISLPLVCW